MIRISAKKKLGRACPSTAMARQMRSIRLPLYSAASTPSGMEISSAKPRAARPSISVVVSLDRISGPASVLKYTEVPKSPCRICQSQSAYCTASGRSRP
ncbi:hypothetical protein D9M70_600010 [compost metagenome]